MYASPFRRASLSPGPSSIQQWILRYALVISALVVVVSTFSSDPTTIAQLLSVNQTSNPPNETVSNPTSGNKTTSQAPGSKFGLIVGLIILAIVIMVALICTCFYVKDKRYRPKEEANSTIPSADQKNGSSQSGSVKPNTPDRPVTEADRERLRMGAREAYYRVIGCVPPEIEQSLKSEVLQPVAPRPTPTNPFKGPPSVLPDPSADWLAQKG